MRLLVGDKRGVQDYQCNPRAQWERFVAVVATKCRFNTHEGLRTLLSVRILSNSVCAGFFLRVCTSLHGSIRSFNFMTVCNCVCLFIV